MAKNIGDRFYGKGLPYLQIDELEGKLLVIEGPDCSGRSTQIQLLKGWLEAKGHAVLDTGLKRSGLVGDAMTEAKKGHTLGKTTMSLLYATDFADQLENKIIPALRAGFIVLSDRYIYSMMVRDLVRGADVNWLKELFGFALIPDLVIQLKVPVEHLLHRVFCKMGRLDYWESGMDIGLSGDMFESFKRYQKLISDQYDSMAEEYKFTVVDGTRSVQHIQDEIREAVKAELKKS